MEALEKASQKTKSSSSSTNSKSNKESFQTTVSENSESSLSSDSNWKFGQTREIENSKIKFKQFNFENTFKYSPSLDLFIVAKVPRSIDHK